MKVSLDLLLYFLTILFLIEALFPKIIRYNIASSSRELLLEKEDNTEKFEIITKKIKQDKYKTILVIIQSLTLVTCCWKLFALKYINFEIGLCLTMQTILSTLVYFTLSYSPINKKSIYLYGCMNGLIAIICLIFLGK